MTTRSTGLCSKWTMLTMAVLPLLVACQSVPTQGAGLAKQATAVAVAPQDVPVPVLGKDAKGQSIIAFFGAPDTDSEGGLFKEAQQGGFYRVYTGKNAAGQLQVQDFYQANGAPQTSVFAVDPAANLLDWAVLPQDGQITFYRPNGAVRGVTTYQQGKLEGKDIYYNADGTERSVYTWRNDLLDGPFFAQYPGSQSRVEGVAKDDSIVSIKAFDDRGQPLPQEDAERLLEASMIFWYDDIFQ